MSDPHREISDVLIRYSTAIDTRDWALFRTCFVEGVVADYGDVGSWDDLEALTEFMESIHAPMGQTLHRVTNIAIEVAPDHASATARAYVDVILMIGDDGGGTHAAGTYADKLVRTDDGWRIAERVHRLALVEGIGPSRQL